ncbi:MAG: hypothetical protein II711_00700 [Clostridia bacterium]|nr:hypothetical protein [Clostridia bacterium]
MTVNGKALYGTGKYTYEVQYKKASSSVWTTRQKFSSNTTVSIKPAAKATYQVRVRVKDTTGKIAAKTFTVKVS